MTSHNNQYVNLPDLSRTLAPERGNGAAGGAGRQANRGAGSTTAPRPGRALSTPLLRAETCLRGELVVLVAKQNRATRSTSPRVGLVWPRPCPLCCVRWQRPITGGLGMREWLDPERDTRERRRCGHCGERFILTVPTRRYCSERCRVRAYMKRHPRAEIVEGESPGLPRGMRWRAFREEYAKRDGVEGRKK